MSSNLPKGQKTMVVQRFHVSASIALLLVGSFGLSSTFPTIAVEPPPTTDPSGNGAGGGTHAKLPPGSRIPATNLGSGSSCKDTPQPLTALVPADAKGLTTRTNPTVWFYVPYVPADLESAQFILVSRDSQQTLYQTPVRFANTPGVVSLALPQNTIAPDQSVRWYLSVNCKGNTQPKPDLQLNGWITRVPAATPNPWYDQLDQLAQRRSTNPQDPQLQRSWQALLKTVKLEPLATAPPVQPSRSGGSGR